MKPNENQFGYTVKINDGNSFSPINGMRNGNMTVNARVPRSVQEQGGGRMQRRRLTLQDEKSTSGGVGIIYRTKMLCR